MATTFDSSRLTNTTLSGGNLVATSTAAGGAMSSRVLSGLTYFEVTITTLTGTPGVGIASSNWDHSTALGTGSNTVGYQPSGAVKLNGATLATIAAYVQGNRIGVAVDPITKLIWFRVNGGNWNNNAANDPVAEVGGIDYSGASVGSIVAAINSSLSGNVWTAIFSAPFTDAVPTGYASLDAIGFTTAQSTKTTLEIPLITSLPASYGLTAGPLPLGQTSQGKHFSPAATITMVSGTTKENGSIVTGKRVDVYDRLTGDLLGTTYSDGSGNWSLPCLGRPAVRVVGSDPTTYNSQVYDDVVPV